MEFDLENPFTNFDSRGSHCSDVACLFRVESDHMLSETYVKSLRVGDSDIIVRRETISSISQLCCRFDPFLSYLGVNYLDRFLSSQRLQKPKPWVLRLLAMSCVSLAAKMQKTDFSLPCLQVRHQYASEYSDRITIRAISTCCAKMMFLLSVKDLFSELHGERSLMCLSVFYVHCRPLQSEGGFIFDSQTIQRMEMLILGALKWRMRSITPFSFLSFFISLLKLEDPVPRQALNARASEIIFKAQNDVTLLEFKPSDIAASALLSASHDLFPLQFSGFWRAIFSCSLVNKDGILSCYSTIQGTAMEGYESVVEVVSSSGTPISVLDQQFSASVSGATTGNSPASDSVKSERLLKRRRMGDLFSNQTVQISQS